MNGDLTPEIDFRAVFEDQAKSVRANLIEAGRHINYLRGMLRNLRQYLPINHPWLPGIDEQIALAPPLSRKGKLAEQARESGMALEAETKRCIELERRLAELEQYRDWASPQVHHHVKDKARIAELENKLQATETELAHCRESANKLEDLERASVPTEAPKPVADERNTYTVINYNGEATG